MYKNHRIGPPNQRRARCYCSKCCPGMFGINSKNRAQVIRQSIDSMLYAVLLFENGISSIKMLLLTRIKIVVSCRKPKIFSLIEII